VLASPPVHVGSHKSLQESASPSLYKQFPAVTGPKAQYPIIWIQFTIP
jgi:hypothetical protein